MKTNVTTPKESRQRLNSATLAKHLFFLLAFMLAFSPPAKSATTTDHLVTTSPQKKDVNSVCIAAASSVVGVDYAASETAGHFNATIDIKVQNAGTVNLFNLALLEDYSALNQYGSAFINLVAPPEIIESTAITNPTINSLYDGTTANSDLLNNDGLLAPGDFFTLRLTIELNPNADGAPEILQHQATAMATGIENNQVMLTSDLSDSGRDPLTSNPNQPGDTGGSDDPTLLSDCFDLLTQGFACNVSVNMAVDGFCNASLDVDAILENHFDVCDGGATFPLGGFYRLQLWFLDGGLIPDLNPETVNIYEFDGDIMNRTIVVRVSEVIYGNTCSGNVFIEDKTGPVCNLSGDAELLVDYDWDNDGIIENDVTDPSGADDLRDEYILCAAIQQNGHDIYFDALEAQDVDGNGDGDFTDIGIDALADFSDCTAVDYIAYEEEYWEVCELGDLIGISVDESRFNPNEFSIAEVYKRTWRAIDVFGQSSSENCVQFVFGLRPKAHRIILQEQISIDCSEDVEVYAPFYTVDNNIENNGLGSMGMAFLFPNGDDAPSVPADEFVYFLDPAGQSCMYSVGYHEDAPSEVCDGSFNFIRHWSVVDWCSGARVYDEFSQLIKVEDKTAPVISVDLNNNGIADTDADGNLISPPASFELETTPFTCNGTGAIPNLVTQDDCSGSVDDVYQVSIERIPDFPNDPNELSIYINSFENGGNINSLNLPLGNYSVQYFAADDCGNESTFTTVLNIRDRQAPVAICNDALNVTLNNYGDGFAARIYGEDLDDSSFDNCQEISFLIRSRENDSTIDNEWNEFVEFNCADLNRDINVELLVFEDFNLDGEFIDLENNQSGDNFQDGIDDFDGGKSSLCLTTIRVEDNDIPSLLCENKTLSCNDPDLDVLFSDIPTEDLDGDGTIDANGFLFAPEIVGGCPNSNDITLSLEVINIDYQETCKKGSFIRRFTATRNINDQELSAVCEQMITIDFVSDWTMTFPSDILIECQDSGNRIPAPLSIDDIMTNMEGCDQWGMEVNDETYDIIGQDGNGACFKVIRTYKFVNWCTWDLTNTELGIVNRPVTFINPGQEVQLRHRSVNFGINEFGDEDDQDIYNEDILNDDDGALITIDGVDNPQSSDINLFGRIYNENINGTTTVGVYAENYGYFVYRQTIKIMDNEAPIVDAFNDAVVFDTLGTCSANFDLLPPTVEECRLTYTVDYEVVNQEGVIFAEGNFPNVVVNSNAIEVEDIPLGVYDINYLVSDQCGNFSTTSYQLTILDGKAPTAYCLYGLAVDLMPNGMVEIEASRFDRGSFDSCSEPLTFSFSPDITDTTKIMTCDSVGTKPQDIFVTDALGNQAFCSNFVTIQAHGEQDLCNSMRQIGGHVQTPDGEEVESVAVYLSGDTYDMSMTSVDGSFSFNAVEDGHDYSLVPEKDINPMNGVSTLDLVIMKKHILGLDLLDTPYQLIAADINNSGHITTFDLVELRKMILNIEPDFTNNTSWRFVPSDYVFPNPENPWAEAFPELLNVNDLEANDMALDFIAIKVGDINGNAIPNNYTAADDRNDRDDYIIELNDMTLSKGNIYTLNFNPTQMIDNAINQPSSQLVGYQMTLNFDTDFIIFEEVEDALAHSDHYGLHRTEEGLITLSWHGDITTADQSLFSFSIQAKKEGQLSDHLSITSTVTTAEAYTETNDGTLTTKDVVLKYNDKNDKIATAYLYQNQPNPFDKMTKIAFDITTADQITLSWYNTSGELVHSIRETYEAGHHEVWVNANDLPAGLLYYSLFTKTEVLTKKMMVIKN